MSENVIDELSRYFELDSDKPSQQNPPELPQNPFRWIVSGASGSGKTHKVVQHILKNELRFDKLYIYAKDIFDKKYVLLANFMQAIADEQGVPVEDILIVGTKAEDIIAVDDLDRTKTNLMIFDDFIAEKRTNNGIIADHFIRGRHENTSYIYLSQSFYAIPKVIRLQGSAYSIFKYENTREVNSIHSSIANSMKKEDFLALYKAATDKPHGSFNLW